MKLFFHRLGIVFLALAVFAVFFSVAFTIHDRFKTARMEAYEHFTGIITR